MNLDDTISKINSIDPVALEERLRIKKPHEGLEIFCDWFKQKTKESEQATTWKIPVECILKKNDVVLTLEEAKYIRTMIDEAMAILVEYLDYGDESPMDDEAKEMFDIFCKRIEDAEKGNGSH